MGLHSPMQMRAIFTVPDGFTDFPKGFPLCHPQGWQLTSRHLCIMPSTFVGQFGCHSFFHTPIKADPALCRIGFCLRYIHLLSLRRNIILGIREKQCDHRAFARCALEPQIRVVQLRAVFDDG